MIVNKGASYSILRESSTYSERKIEDGRVTPRLKLLIYKVAT